MVESKLVSSLRFNQKGQGTIEYILLLVITVTMILLALSNLFKPMQAFLQNYMGTYVACLLSSGELPAIRTENNLKDSDPKCNFSYTAGTAKMNVNGSNYNGSSGGPGENGSGSSGSNGSGADGKDGKGKDGSGGDGSGVDGKGGGSGNAYAGSRSRRSGFGSNSSRRRSSDSSSVGDDGDGKKYVNNLDRNNNDRFFRAQQRTRSGGQRNGRGIALSGLTEEEQKKIERKIQASPRAVPKSSEEFSVPGKKSVVQPPPTKRQIATDTEEESTGIGGFLKYLIIAAIILLILILGGGQAFEMSKSMD